MKNKFHFRGIAAVVTAVRQWDFGKSKAEAGGCGLSIEDRIPKPKKKPPALKSPFSPSSPPLALCAYDYDSDCKALRDRFCVAADKWCRNENGLDGHWQSIYPDEMV